MSSTISQTELLAKVLDLAGMRHRLIAQNIANVNTPNYKRLDAPFEEELSRAVASGNAGDLAKVRARAVEASTGPARMDGNTVSFEEELGMLTKNSLLYNAATQLLTTRLSMLRSAIAGR